MRNKFMIGSLLLLNGTLLANVEALIDFDAFEKDGEAVSTYALQGPINDKSPLENCAAKAANDVKRFEAKGYKLGKVECVPAGFERSSGKLAGYRVIIHKAQE
ncbi:MAG: hypothetical protein HYR96_03035 [Deltaproteobacteria bacterium]|nr:hypothetical protein [Deltaproteobacteria bacterium]MBI3294074.1 hypothetical protein [Deltaproteobacteria bacterium]